MAKVGTALRRKDAEVQDFIEVWHVSYLLYRPRIGSVPFR